MASTDDLDIGGDPASYGIQNPEAPGEPDYWSHGESEPVPGVHKETRGEQEGTRGAGGNLSEGAGHHGGSGGRGGHGGH
jgi:hypothetical protein